MKKIPIFLASAIAVSSILPLSTAFAQENITVDISDVIEFYDDTMSQPQWYNNVDRAERGEMLQLPDYMLLNMSTDTLIDAVLEYPFFCDIYAFDNPQDGIDILFNTFNGAKELSQRTDAKEVLMKKYEDEPVITKDSPVDTDDFFVRFRFSNMDCLLSQDFIIKDLNEDEIAELSEIVVDKYKQKLDDSTIYSNGSSKMFFKLIDVDVNNTNSQNLISETENALNSLSDSEDNGIDYSGIPSYVSTPNGSQVPVTIYNYETFGHDKDEDCTLSDAISQTKLYKEIYPNAILLRSPTGKYNCHSYAWYSQESNNNRWMDDPTLYMTDGSYNYTNNPGINNRVVYFTNNKIDHSAIVRERLTGASQNKFLLDMVIVDSKWGRLGLYRHNGADSPYRFYNKIEYYYH